jgi:hypothetical protein
MQRKFLSAALIAAFVPCALPAQSSFVVPSWTDQVDGTSIRRVAGFDHAVHQQLLIDPMHLQALAGRTVTSIAWRRDVGSDNEPLRGGQVQLRIWLSTATVGANAPSATFAANRGTDRTLVFDGVVNLPAAAPGTIAGQVPVPATFSVRVDLDPTAPFVYQTGTTLLVELEGAPVPGREAVWWPVDAEASAVSGTVTEVGAACGSAAKVHPRTAFASPRDLVPGRIAELRFRGQPATPAVMLASLGSQAGLVPLEPFGPGCALHLIPPFLLQLPVATAPTEARPRFGAFAVVELPLPGDASVLGLSFSVQWLQFAADGLHMSNALDLSVASTLPGLGMALVEAKADATGAFPAHGTVDTTTGLVLEIGHQ